MLRKFLICLLYCATAGLLFPEETVKIDIALLDKAPIVKYTENRSPVSWNNFNSGKQIRDMGRKLGAEIRYQEQIKKAESPYTSGYPSYKYRAVRIYPDKRAGADVVYIGKYSKVDTFRNLTRIISGYIEEAYGIPMEKADSIAAKICYWNTNHYNDKNYFRVNFEVRIREVFNNRTSNIGLAKSYKNWPGKTRIVIPFKMIKEAVPEVAEPVQPKVEPPPEPAKEPQPAVIQPTVVQPNLQPETDTAPEQDTDTGITSLPLFVLVLIGIAAAALIVLIIFLIKILINKLRRQD